MASVKVKFRPSTVVRQQKERGYKSILSDLRNLKGSEFEGLSPFLTFLTLGLLATFLISGIK